MNPVRIVYEDTPDSIPIPAMFRHRKTEIIVWPLDEPTTIHARDEPIETASMGTPPSPGNIMMTPAATLELPDLEEFRATLPMQTVSAGDFCRAMRDQDRY